MSAQLVLLVLCGALLVSAFVALARGHRTAFSALCMFAAFAGAVSVFVGTAVA